MDPASFLSSLLGWAVVLPLLSFTAILLGAKWMGRAAAYVAVMAIGGACLLSFLSMCIWLGSNWPPAPHHGHAAGHGEHGDHHAPGEDSHGKEHAPEKEDAKGDHRGAERSSTGPSFPVAFLAQENEEKASAKGKDEAAHAATADGGKADLDHAAGAASAHAGPYAGEYWVLGKFGSQRLNISYYIDSLTICMFCMVTLIATLIHLYAIGYMHDELHDFTDPEVQLANGQTLKRPGRFPRFFQYLSLFCFSMLGLVLAGNIAMVFVFWELVGICSYFLIGFYIERKSASNAANKAFIVNRVGDFGMIIGLMAIWSSVGTFSFGHYTVQDADADEPYEVTSLFDEVQRVAETLPDGQTTYRVLPPAGMAIAASPDRVAAVVSDHADLESGHLAASSEIRSQARQWQLDGAGYWLLVVAGIGIFCGCVGKSAQFPLHVWLPDAMEGPTPVSALVHSATMVAAGVYLVGRFYPVFCPEVLLVIAVVGCITLLLAASIALVANDIKRVLAYSTVSQLGYMMLSLGLGGWLAGLMHLITHAFFKSLLFMCSGSVIHAVHTNDMRHMGGLLKKMPVTAITMLIGCLAISGVGVPFLIGFSGYYSKDYILEQAYSFSLASGSPYGAVFFAIASGGAAMTAFYMFRLWYLTFVGKPRDEARYDHAHESPPVMYMPLVILAVFAIAVAWDWKLAGYGLFAAVFFLAKGWTDGWFRSSAAAGHGHDDHAHGGHGHDEPGHAAQGHGDHAHHGPTLTLTPAWVLVMLLVTISAGAFFQFTVGPRIEAIEIGAGRPLGNFTLQQLLEASRPSGTLVDTAGHWLSWRWPNELASHDEAIARPVTLLATGTWMFGITLATLMYALGYLSPADVRRQFSPVYTALWNKWYFDELYDFLFVRPTHVISRFISGIDKRWIDGLIDWIAVATKWFSRQWDLIVDRGIVDFAANLLAGWTYATGLSLRGVQTGRVRQYAMFVVLGTIAVFAFIYIFLVPELGRGR